MITLEEIDRIQYDRNKHEVLSTEDFNALCAAARRGVSEQDAKIKRMGEALRVCDLALSKVSDGSTSGEFRKVYADALRDAGVSP